MGKALTREILEQEYGDLSVVKEIRISREYDSIDPGAFFNCASLVLVTIPNNIKIIPGNCFCYCRNLVICCEAESRPDGWDICWSDDFDEIPIYWGINEKNILIQNKSIYLIKDDETILVNFFGKLHNIIIPNNVTCIGYMAFHGCSSLTSIKIPNSVTSIEFMAFCGCRSLTSIRIPNNVTSIGSMAFCGCSSLTSIKLPNSITSIESSLLECCRSLTSIRIPNNVTSIGSMAFCGCSSLTSIKLPNSITSIGSSALEGCRSLTSMTFENGIKLTSISDNAFNGCISLRYNEYGNCYYLGNKENPYLVLVKAKCESISNAIIHKKAKIILGGAFKKNSISSIIIPKNIKIVESGAFSNCLTLTIYCEENSKPLQWKLDWHDQFNKVYWGVSEKNFFIKNGVIYLIREKEAIAVGHKEIFSSELKIPSKILIHNIPYTVTSIGELALAGCKYLTSLIIPNSITKICTHSIRWCSSLKRINFEESSNLRQIDSDFPQNLNTIIQYDSKKGISWKNFANMFHRGEDLLEGKNGYEKDINQAIFWFVLSAAQNYPNALYKLGTLYLAGIGVKKDLSLAEEYFNKAKEQGIDVEKELNQIKNEKEAIFKRGEAGLEFNYQLAEDPDVFISWNQDDKNEMLAIRNKINQEYRYTNRIAAWDSDNNAIGINNDAIQLAITGSKLMIAIISIQALKSNWIQKEVKQFLKKSHKDYFKPIFLGKCECDNSITFHGTSLNGKHIWDILNIYGGLKNENQKNEFVDCLIDNKIIHCDKSRKEIIKSNLSYYKFIHDDFAGSFCNGKDESIDYKFIDEVKENEIMTFVKTGLQRYYIYDKQERLKESAKEYKAILTSVRCNDSIGSSISTSKLGMENYIERKIIKGNTEILEKDFHKTMRKENVFLIAPGGSGKTVFLQHFIGKNITNQMIFYLPCSIINSIFNHSKEEESIHSLGELIYQCDFAKSSRKELIVNAIENDYLHSTTNQITIIIDALDEMSDENSQRLFQILNENHYFEIKNKNFVFTSRNLDEPPSPDLRKILENTTTYQLKEFTPEDIRKLYENIKNFFQRNNYSINEEEGNNFLETRSRLLEETHDTALENPLFLTNSLYIYFASGCKTFVTSRNELLEKSTAMLIDNLEKDKDIWNTLQIPLGETKEEAERNKQKVLYRLLGRVAYLSSMKMGKAMQNLTVSKIFQEELSSTNIELSIEKCEEIYKYLSLRDILSKGVIKSEFFRQYFLAHYLLNTIYDLSAVDDSIFHDECLDFMKKYDLLTKSGAYFDKSGNYSGKELLEQFAKRTNIDFQWFSALQEVFALLDYELSKLSINPNYLTNQKTIQTLDSTQNILSSNAEELSSYLNKSIAKERFRYLWKIEKQ